jgi:hypothetical protein
MEIQSFKSDDDLIRGIKTILSNYRCSFSDEEQVLLRQCINKLEKSRADPDSKDRYQASVEVLGMLLRIFILINHIKDLF